MGKSFKKASRAKVIVAWLVSMWLVSCQELPAYDLVSDVPDSLFWPEPATTEEGGLYAYLREPLMIGGVPCKCDQENPLGFSVESHPNGRLAHCWLEYPVTFQNVHCKEFIALHQSGRLGCTVSTREYEVNGVACKAGHICLHENGWVSSCILAEDWEKGDLFLPAGTIVSFWENGMPSSVSAYGVKVGQKEYRGYDLEFDVDGNLTLVQERGGHAGGY